MQGRFQTESLSRSGGRDYNEDFCIYECLEKDGERYDFWMVADGLGGHGGGEVASKTFVEKTYENFQKNPGLEKEKIMTALKVAQEELLALQKKEQHLAKMRTTFALLISDGIEFFYVHLGDSRIYLIRNGETKRPLTNDHSVPWAFMKTGEIKYKEIRRHIDRNRLLKAAGNEDDFRPEFAQGALKLMEQDAFLLCTDGFWDYVDEIGIMADYAKAHTAKEWIVHMERRLLSFLEEKQITNNDNYTAMVIMAEKQAKN